jgi:hypothetical protein
MSLVAALCPNTRAPNSRTTQGDCPRDGGPDRTNHDAGRIVGDLIIIPEEQRALLDRADAALSLTGEKRSST